jgi:hypothetical protein
MSKKTYRLHTKNTILEEVADVLRKSDPAGWPKASRHVLGSYLVLPTPHREHQVLMIHREQNGLTGRHIIWP